MRTVLRAQKVYKKKNNKYATSLADLVHTGSFTKRMVNPDRGDYSVGFKPQQRRLRPDHDSQATRRRAPLVLCRRRWHDPRRRPGPGNREIADGEMTAMVKIADSMTFRLQNSGTQLLQPEIFKSEICH